MRLLIVTGALAAAIAAWPASSRACSIPCTESLSITGDAGLLPVNVPGLYWQRTLGGGFEATAHMWRVDDSRPVAVSVEYLERATHLIRIDGALAPSTIYELELAHSCEEGRSILSIETGA